MSQFAESGDQGSAHDHERIFAGAPVGQAGGQQSKLSFLQVPEMIKIDDAWKFVELPRAIDPEKPVVAATAAALKTLRVDAPGASTLTEAELRLLPYLATHLSFREIGLRLRVSTNTVKTQALAVYRKLDVSCRSDAVERGRQAGLISDS